MAVALEVVHRIEDGSRSITVPAARAGAVPLTSRGEVWRPARHPSQRSIATWWWAATTGKLVGCRSMNVLAVAMLLDFNPSVTEFTAWPAKIKWRARGRERSVVPDFFVRTDQGATLVVACPPASGQSLRWQRQQQVLRQACDEAGWELAMPRIPEPMALSNLRWVARYRHPRCGDREVEQALKAAFRNPCVLEEGVRATGLPRLSTLPRLYHLLWRRELAVEWNRAMGPDSVIRASGRMPSAMRLPFETDAT
ncbi:TnsA-like heteromeric transposase endonuclease subunit [Streptomyces sp. NBC_00564]|uniref:TnsA-like heteromeric transposase endonuclease subunit n=1 Tax=Streptomyces sp. NBC_00564 TaxID=2903663 RepID=UPI00352C8E2E|nr:TnsA-like heteromeric transposase endonuclease subunit [Streptomyces sp. NBC_00564]